MTTKTINQLAEEVNVTSSDLIGVWDESAGTYDNATITNIIGTRVSGSGTISTGTYVFTIPATGTAALLGTAQSFTATQTIAPTSTSSIGMLINMPTNTTQRAFGWSYNGTTVGLVYGDATQAYISLVARDMGNGSAGPRLSIERNSNGTNSAAGTLRLMRYNGVSVMYYCDADAKLRQHTVAPTNGTDNTVGSLVGDQTSWYENKDIIEQNTNTEEALQKVLNTPVYDFMLKAGSYLNSAGERQVFTGVVGFDRDSWVLKGCGPEQDPALNEYTLFGNLILAMQKQQELILSLECRINELEK